MPTYEYLCQPSNQEFEAEHSIVTVLEDCPLCKEAGREQHIPKRLISGGSGKGIVEQTIAELKASLPGEVAKIQQRASKDMNFLANFIGEGAFHKNETDRNKR